MSLRQTVIDDETATRYYNELNTNAVEDDGTKLKALTDWADAKDAERNKHEWDHLTRVYTDFDNYISDEGYSDLDEESRYRIANRQFIANQLGETVEDQGQLYPAKRDIWTEQAFGKKGLSEKETFGLIQQGVQSRNDVVQSANEIPGDIALGLFNGIGTGTQVEVPKLVSIWKERNAEKLKKLPKGWESGLLESASAYAAETEGMLRDYAQPLKQVYDHLAAVTGRKTQQAGEQNPKNLQDMESLADTLATMPPEVRDRAYAAVVLGAKQAGQEPKAFLEQWGESWSRTLNMFRSGSMVMQEDAAHSELQILKEAPKVWKEKDTGKLTVYPGFDQSNFEEVTPEERPQLTAEAQKKFDRLQVYRELYNIADNQFDPIKKINEGGFGGFMESMAYGSPQALAYTGMVMVPYAGPWLAGAAIYADEYNNLRLDGINPDAARKIAAPSAILQSGLEHIGAHMIFGKLPAFEKLITKIGNPARVGRVASAGIRLGGALAGENMVEGAQDLTTPVVQSIASALSKDVPNVNWGETLGQWGSSRLDVLAATIPGILIGTGVATMEDGKRFNDFNERLDLYKSFGMDEAAIKRVEDAQTPQDRQAALQTEYKSLTPDNIKAGISYMETKIDEARSIQEDPNLPTMTREQGENGKPVFVVRDEKGVVSYRSEDEQSAMTAHREMLRTRITGSTTGIVESLQYIDRVNQALSRGEDIQKLLLDDAPRTLLDDYEANPTEQNLDRLFETVRAFGMDISEPAELANFPILASNRGALTDGIYKSIIRIQDGATGIEVMRDFSQDNLKRAISEGRISMDWVREQLNQVIPLIESERTERKLRTETDTDVIESFSDVAVAYMNGKIRDEQVPGGLRGFLRRIAVVVKDIFRRAYRLKRAIAEGNVDSNFEGFLAESVGLNQQTLVDTTTDRVSNEVLADTDKAVFQSRAQATTDVSTIRAANGSITGPANYSIGAFHGTPHKVDEFSTEKIGTGEGAQAYGWGLYFAENKNTAQSYKDNLSKGGLDSYRFRGKEGYEWQSYFENKGDYEKSGLWEQIQLHKTKNEMRDFLNETGASKATIQYFESLPENLFTPPELKGNLYSVELDVEPEDLLDWDKPLREQSPKVQAAAQKAQLSSLPDGKTLMDVDGKFIYRMLVGDLADGKNNSAKAASEALLAAGIPGLRYLDGNSRAGGSGTHNFVIFDESKIKITGENGQPVAIQDAMAAPAVSTDTNYSIGNYSPEQKYNQIIPEITSVDPNKVSRRDMYEIGKVSPEVAAKMKFDEPVQVSLFADGTMMLSDGHHRVAAAKELGMKKIPAVVRSINAKGKHINSLIADQSTPDINYSIGIDRNAISQVSDKDDASRVGTAKLGTSKVPKNTPQDSNVSGDNVPDDLLAKQMEKMNYAHLPKSILSEQDPGKKRRKLINWFKKNLLALHDAFPEEFRARATHWYDGANRIAKEMGSQFKASVEQASGVIAVFSPQKDWFMNVAQAKQFMELWRNSQDVVLEESLVRAEIEGIIEAATAPDKQKRKKVNGETKEQTAERREYNKALDERAKVDRRKKVEQVIGKTIRQLDSEPDLQGWAIRVLAQVTFGRNYRNLSPEGDQLGMATNDDGALAKNGWGSINEIEKAVRIMKDGSLKNISDNLGNEHKVRNFYNNIAAPNTSFGDATIDTHAVAAAHLMPYGAKATEVSHNFGSGMNGSEVLGISGVYHIYLDAYREAAAARGILPRQMQSITWEAIRLVYPAAQKNANTLASSEKTWKTMSDANARSSLVGGRIPSPVWAGANDNRESQGDTTGVGKNAGPEGVSGRSLLSGVRPTGTSGQGRDGVVNYSISSQSEIDRVNRAMSGVTRGPSERLAIYERAKAKFGGLMDRNREALESLNKGTAKFRRTQLLQGLGELDAILSVFPPDIRGRVGGYTKLASIAPMDVFKDGEKVSEVSGMTGALISAWMREGQNIGQAGKQTELPPRYTTKENLSTARADRALADFFKQRIGMIDREVEKTLRREYDTAFRTLLDRTKPKKAAPGEKPKGIGADIQDLFAVVREAIDMNAVDVAAHIAGLDAKIASGELTAEQEARAQVEAALVALVGDWRNADADRRKSALDEATRIWSGAYASHTQKVIQLREQREAARLEAIQATGKAGDLAGRKSKAIQDSGLKGSWKDYILNLLNFDQVAGILFGENSETANTLIDRQRAAENLKEDGQQAKMQALEDYFTNLAGGNLLAGEQLRYNLAQPSMEVQGIKMSELEGLSAVMMWEQEDGRRHMTGELDETGKPSGSWHYDQAFIDEIMANLSPEALQLRDWLLKKYADEYANINAVYSELNGVNLPQIRNYSPVTVQPLAAPTGQVLDPVSGSAMSGASTSPGALRTRGTAIAEPRFQDVLQTYIAHTLQMEHWKAFAPYIADANGVLRNRDVQNSVEEKGGAEARKILNAWLDYFAQGGTRDAGAHLALNQGISNVLGRASQVALIGRASTLLVQSTQLGAAIAEMPVKAYLKRMGKLLTGQLGWDAAINSPYIQRRIAQMPPVVQMAMQGLKGAKPTAIQQASKRLGNLLSGADGLFTAGTYAITYDYHLTKANELGLTGAEAEAYARNIAERVTDRIAQPTRQGARSLYENTSTNPLARAGWAFASEARKNLALVAYSFAERDTATKLRTLAYVVALNSIASGILRSIWRDILDDDDDELFDDKYWSPKRIALAVATEPLYGFPVLGSTAQNAIYKAFGEYKPSGTMFDVDGAINPVKRIPEYLSGDFEMRDVMRDIDMIVSAMGLMHPNIAAAASLTHLAKDLFNLGDSAVDAATDK